MFSNKRWFHRNKSERKINGYGTVFSGPGSYDLSNYNPDTPGMFRAPKMNTVINILGVPTYLVGIFLNIGDWKGNLLIFFGVVFSFFKIIRLLVNLWQDYREREIELKAKKKRYDEDEDTLNQQI